MTKRHDLAGWTQLRRRQGSRRRLLISVALAPPYVQRLAEFTRAHLNHPVALVLDGEVMSIHKVRTIVAGGRMQITRCDEHACEWILSKLANSDDDDEQW